ncbi:hypothetical protein C8R44DRAFT_737631 [Mycena epipterygia]|nr:hypothetical protein C8R44DRAFT_737631 [Mycena epipterygia]
MSETKMNNRETFRVGTKHTCRQLSLQITAKSQGNMPGSSLSTPSKKVGSYVGFILLAESSNSYHVVRIDLSEAVYSTGISGLRKKLGTDELRLLQVQNLAKPRFICAKMSVGVGNLWEKLGGSCVLLEDGRPSPQMTLRGSEGKAKQSETLGKKDEQHIPPLAYVPQKTGVAG